MPSRPNSSQEAEEERREAKLRSLWSTLDRDNSGTLSRKELDCKAFRDMVTGAIKASVGGMSYERAEMNMGSAINMLLNKADMSHDKRLSYEEFRSVVRFLQTGADAECDDKANLVFALFDLDNSNSIDKTEFHEMMRFFLGRTPTHPEFLEEWHRIQTSADSKEVVTRRQYIRWLQQSKNPTFRQYAPPPGSKHYSPETKADADVDADEGIGALMFYEHWGAHVRYKWNSRFNAGLSLAQERANHQNDHRPLGTRHYFMRPESLPELTKFYDEYRGFDRHKMAMQSPPPTPPVIRDYPKCLSSGNSTLLTLPGRHAPGGFMTSHSDGQVILWDDHWLTPAGMAKKGTASERPMPPLATFGDAPDSQKYRVRLALPNRKLQARGKKGAVTSTSEYAGDVAFWSRG